MRTPRALVIAGAALIAILTGAATAQANGIQAHVPFAFVVNGTRLPAGTYEIRPVDQQRTAWIVQNQRGNRSAIIVTGAYRAPASATPDVEFATMGGEHILSGFVSDNTGQGRDVFLTPKRMERQLVSADERAG